MAGTERRAVGTGNILTRGGRYSPRIRVRGKLVGLGTVDTREEAERLIAAAKARLLLSNHLPSGELTLGDWFKTCLDRRERSGFRDGGNDRNRFKTHVEPHWIADIAVGSVTSSNVREWLQEVQDKRVRGRRKAGILSPRTVKRCFGLLSVVLQMAVEQGTLDSNPCRGVRLPRQRVAQEAWAYLDLAEQRAIEKSEKIPEADKLRIQFAMFVGLRQGEQWNLRLSDVRPDDPTGPHVIVRFGSKGKSPKNGKVRRVPLLPDAVRVWRRWAELLPTYAKENPDKLAWPTVRGCRRHLSKNYGFRGFLRAAGITKSFRWHDLRHTTASSLVSGIWGRAWTLQEVAQVLGHSSVQVTERYAHLAPNVVQDAASATRGSLNHKEQSARDSDASRVAGEAIAHVPENNAVTNCGSLVVREASSAERAQIVIPEGLTRRAYRAFTGPTEPKVVRSNRTGRAQGCVLHL